MKIAWAAWPLRYLRVPILILNIAMAIASIVAGAHYFVDIIAGLLVGSACVLLSGWLDPTNGEANRVSDKAKS